LAVLTLLIGLAAARSALAALGDDVTTIEADRAHMKAAAVVHSQAGLYTVHEMQTPSGTTVREYTNPSGVVFAVSWNGPFMPDLQQLLGRYFERYQTAPRTTRYGHSHAVLEQPDLVVQSGGHMRAFAGKAYVPQLVPPGVAVDQLEGQSTR
jgi:hypothetical protein